MQIINGIVVVDGDDLYNLNEEILVLKRQNENLQNEVDDLKYQLSSLRDDVDDLKCHVLPIRHGG